MSAPTKPKLPATVPNINTICLSEKPKIEVKNLQEGFTQHTDKSPLAHGFPSMLLRMTITDPAPRETLGQCRVTFKVPVAELNGINLGIYLTGITETQRASPQTGWVYTLTFVGSSSPTIINSVERATVVIE